MNEKNLEKNYIYLDGDNIGDKLEFLILKSDLKSVSDFSNAIKNSVKEISKLINSLSSSELIIAGGDDILFSISNDIFSMDIIEKINNIFIKNTGCTLSGGMGDTAQSALFNLKKAKSQGSGHFIKE